jgi:hypothetical protein
VTDGGALLTEKVGPLQCLPRAVVELPKFVVVERVPFRNGPLVDPPPNVFRVPLNGFDVLPLTTERVQPGIVAQSLGFGVRFFPLQERRTCRTEKINPGRPFPRERSPGTLNEGIGQIDRPNGDGPVLPGVGIVYIRRIGKRT